ncbi:hypothetical protein D3C79_729950 [compost metagenome]
MAPKPDPAPVLWMPFSLISPEPRFWALLSALMGAARAMSSGRVIAAFSPAAACLVGCSSILSPAAGVPDKSISRPCPASSNLAGGVVPVASEVRLPVPSMENTS